MTTQIISFEDSSKFEDSNEKMRCADNSNFLRSNISYNASKYKHLIKQREISEADLIKLDKSN